MTSNKLTDFTVSLDLDSTLVCSSEEMKSLEDLKVEEKENRHLIDRIFNLDLVDVTEDLGSGIRTPYWGVYRPHVFEFLLFTSQYFKKVAVWSAGQYRYVHAICDKLFPDSFLQPDLIFTWGDCEKKSKNVLYKPLKKLYSHKELKGFSHEKNTFALDDNSDTFGDNVDNGINIPEYLPSMTSAGIMARDDSLLQLMCWLSLRDVKECNDVRDLDKTKIFTTSLNDYKTLLQEDNIVVPYKTDYSIEDTSYIEFIGNKPYYPREMPELTELNI
jgi:hypothetical protein